MIQFGQPLTLIVGQNGTGKTTIIECLKYATTGDLPPNSKGGAFIHDPKITGEKEVKAQVKLAFNNCNGNAMICTRSMQLLVKRTTQTFKTLEGQLVIFNHNEKTTISTKNAELDSQLPFYLGVSKSILEYVIFCHQEDSLWPLSEPSNLKKRFDEIFEALKFTKALDSIKNIRKALAVEIKLLEQSVKHLQLDKDKATKATERKQDLQEQIDKYKEDVENLNESINEVNEQLSKLFKSNQEFQAVVAKLDNLRFSKQSYNEQIKRLEQHIDFLHDDDETLSEKASNFQQQIDKFRAEIELNEEDNENKIEELNETRDLHSAKIRQEGELKGSQKNYQNNLAKRASLINDSYSLVFGSDTQDEINDSVISRYTKQLQTVKSNKEFEAQKFTQKRDNQLSELEAKLQQANSNLSSQRNLKDYTNQDIKKIEAENDAINKKINNVQFDEGSTEYEKSLLESMESKLRTLKSNNTVETLSTKLKENEAKIAQVENEIDDINKQISMSSKRSDIYAKVSLLQEDQKYREKAISSLISKHSETFKELFGSELRLEDCQLVYSQIFEEQEEALRNLTNENEKSQQNISDAQSKLKYISEDLSQKQRKYRAAKGKIADTLPDDTPIEEYEQYLKELEEDYKVAIQNSKLKETTKEFNVKALEIAQKEKFCVLCRRNFNNKELDNFLALLTDLTKNININDDEEIKECEQYLNEARSIANDVATVRSLAKELPNIENERSEAEKIVDAIVEDQKKHAEVIRTTKKKLVEIESFKQPLNEMSRMSNELKNIKSQLTNMQEELNEFGIGIKTSEELQELQFNKNNEFKNLRRLNKNLTEEREVQVKEVNKLKNQIKDKRLFINNLERSLMEKENLKQTLAINVKKIEELVKTVHDVDIKLLELQKLYEKLADEYSQYKIQSFKELNQLNTTVQQVANVYNELSAIEQQIKNYLEKDEQALRKCEKEVLELEKKIEHIEFKINEKSELISELRGKIANQDKFEKNIRDNLQLRELNKKMADISDEIDNLKTQNAEAEKLKYDKQSIKLQTKLADLQSNYGGKLGEIRQMENQIRQIAKELKEDYRDINEMYHKEWVTLQTKTLINDDLFKYGTALDSAIMKYHSIKMQEINKVIDELWHTTYRGTDVDTIQIKSDVNLQSKGNRSYNYRVIMKKQDVELDMRGRCSAGQKVLASIIIRLALAECFGISCGMIALDEPTTNLDTENSESLAQSLGQIIEMRRHQKNFQLIVITHDEKFLAHMNAAKYTDHFYRVTRNERQKSEIEWVNITRVSEE